MADTCGSDPSCSSIFPSRLQTMQALLKFCRTASQLLSDRSNILPRYLKVSTPSMHSESYSPVRLNVASLHPLAIATSLLCHHICVFWSHQIVRWCLSSRPAGMCILHRSQWGSRSLPSCSTAIRENKFLYMKCYLIRPMLCATSGQPSTRHLTVLSTWGK